ncbi:50S ribosomal protein L9 [Floccifex sp.]|uniref:50S ribosomal protein L9 n=1 Tax=Floccifex sp. TaxID=2815810 RepID=UPI002A7649C0|nr:50S ribosomal protein L9 [Floccifex sp.]MDD7281359.1 50S ribosomal protein L9 [Erysipelotrichaceae bacterium]MDY2958012.1 50S ribosomal protein L9 [Floccifex sp.]
MKVILLKDVKKLGKKDEVLEVSDGYARNYLIKNKLAVAYTKGSEKVLEKQLEEKALEEEKLKEQAIEVSKQLASVRLEFSLNAGKEGQVFGSISSKQIFEALNRKGIKVDKRKIKMDEAICSLGTTKVKVDLYHGIVWGEITVHVSAKG